MSRFSVSENPDLRCIRQRFIPLILLLPVLAAAQQAPQTPPISLDADSSSLDRKSNKVVFNGLRITQGDFTIAADNAEASGLDFEKSEWSFNGNVRLSIDSASIQSSTAQVLFEAHELLAVRLHGTPAVFEDTDSAGGPAIRGGAALLEYDSAARTLRMTEGAWLSEGSNEFGGCDRIYDIDAETITSGSSECGDPVVITVLPPAEEGPEDTAAGPNESTSP